LEGQAISKGIITQLHVDAQVARRRGTHNLRTDELIRKNWGEAGGLAAMGNSQGRKKDGRVKGKGVVAYFGPAGCSKRPEKGKK